MEVETVGVGTVGVEAVDPQEELRRLDEQIQSAAGLAALKPIFFRLNEIMQAFPGDFDVQLAGNDIKQHVMARGALLKQQEASASPPSAPPPPATPAAQPTSPPVSFRDTEATAPATPPGPTMTLAATVSFPLFPLFSSASPPPEPPSPPAHFVDTVAPAPVTPLESAVMTAAPAAPVSYPLLDAAPPQQPPLTLALTAENPPEPPAPSPPATPEAQPEPAPTLLLDTVAPAPAAAPEAGAIPEAPPLPSLSDAAPLEQLSLALGVTAENPPEPPVMQAASPLPSLFDSAPAEPLAPALDVTPEDTTQPATRPAAWPPSAMLAAEAAPLPTSLLETEAAAPVAAPETPVMPAASPLPSLFDSAPAEPLAPALDVTPEDTPQPATQPAAPPPSAMLEAEPAPLPTSLLDTVATAPAAAPETPVMPAASPLPPLSGAAPPEPLPPALDMKPEDPPRPFKRPPAPPAAPPRRPASRWNRAVVIGPIAGLAVALVLILVVVHQHRKRNADIAARNRAAVQVAITTTPPGAFVKVTAEQSAAGGNKGTTCTAGCKLALTPGTYRISASLDGFEPAAGAVTVAPLKPAAVSLTLQPQAQSVRLLTDLDQGKVAVDDRPPVDLREGQLVLDKVAAGTHTVKITGQDGDASFSFQIADARLPAVGPVSARNMIAVLVASFGKQARMVTNAGPWKLVVNGQPQSDAVPAGTNLTSFKPGVNEIVVGEGKEQRNMSESFGAAPMLTAFLKTDVNAGTLIVSTSQDDVRVFLNGKEYRLHTQRGKLRIPILGKVAVRVAKGGFLDEPTQTADVKKGAEVRLQFDLKPQPQFGSLQIHGAIAGTEILVDQKTAGTVGPDGLFTFSSVPPGEHTIELRREQYQPKRLQRPFHAGQAVVLSGADAVLTAASGTIRLARNPASANVTYRRGDETELHEARGNQIDLPPGTYTFSANAPGFLEFTTRVQVAAGENREVEFTLRERPAAAPPAGSNAMAEFEDAQGWTKDGDSWVHKGGGFVPFKLPPKGVFTFKVELVKGGGVFRAGQIRWCVQYLDSKNYLLSEIDRKNFRAWVVQNGQRLERVPKTPHSLGNQKAFRIQIEVAADHLVQKVRVGDEWKVIDTFAEPGRDFTQGKFGFLIQGNDEIAISDFKFLPK